MGLNLEKKVIVITGASSGIGKATAIACAKAKMRVVLAARGEARLAEVAKQVEALGAEVLPVVCDVCIDNDVTNLMTQTVERFGSLYSLFANAGYGLYRPILETTDQQMRDLFETNFYGTVRCILQAVPMMKKQGAGHVIICSSAASEISLPMYGFYAATKASQDSIAGALRAELDPRQIPVTTVHPIGTRTGFFDAMKVQSKWDGVGLNTPANLMQSPEKVARGIVRCLKSPRHEIWPSPMTRFGVAMATAFPSLSAMMLRRIAANQHTP